MDAPLPRTAAPPAWGLHVVAAHVRRHLAADWHPAPYAAAAALVCTLLSLNYGFALYDTYLRPLTGPPRLLATLGLYGALYALAAALAAWHRPAADVDPEAQPGAARQGWATAAFAILLAAVDSSGVFTTPLLQAEWLPPPVRLWTYKVWSNLSSALFVVVPLWWWYRHRDRPQLPPPARDAYGLLRPGMDKRTYLLLLACLLPLLALATQLPGFLRKYPLYAGSGAPAAAWWQLPEWLLALGFELAYGFDFLTVEWVFRGLLVLGVARALGSRAVLAAAVLYCGIHLGKPLGEAASSVLGGYVLGVLALRTRSIWGGVLVHVGLAWGMELAAKLAKLP